MNCVRLLIISFFCFLPAVLTAQLLPPVYDVTAYGADATGTTDAGSSIKAAATALQSNGSGTLYFPPGTYKVFTVGTTYSSFMPDQYSGGTQVYSQFVGLTNVAVVAANATVAIDSSRTFSSNYGWMFRFKNCRNVKIDGFNVTGPSMDVSATNPAGVVFALFDEGNSNVSMPNNRVQGVEAGVITLEATTASNRSHDFDIGFLDVSGAWYGFNGQKSPDNVRIGLLRTENVHRSYLVSGVKNHTLNVVSKGAKGNDCFLWSPDSAATIENIRLNYSSGEDYTGAGSSNNRVYMWVQGSGAAIRDVDVHLNVVYPAGSGNTSGGNAVAISNGSATDSYTRTVENIRISGTIKGDPAVADNPLIGTLNYDVWNSYSVIRNIKLEDLTIDSTKYSLFLLPSLQGAFTISNVDSTAPIRLQESLTDTNPPHTGFYRIISSTFPNRDSLYQYTTGSSSNSANGLEFIAANSSVAIPVGWTGHTVMQNAFAASTINYTLPAAKVGLEYTFIKEIAGKTITVTPQSGDSIGQLSAGTAVVLPNRGSLLHLRCVFSTPDPTAGSNAIWEVVSQENF